MGLYNASYSNLIDQARLNRQAAHKTVDTIRFHSATDHSKLSGNIVFPFGEACHSKPMVAAGLTYQLAGLESTAATTVGMYHPHAIPCPHAPYLAHTSDLVLPSLNRGCCCPASPATGSCHCNALTLLIQG